MDNKKKKIIIISASIAAALAVVILLFIFMNDNTAENTEPVSTEASSEEITTEAVSEATPPEPEKEPEVTAPVVTVENEGDNRYSLEWKNTNTKDYIIRYKVCGLYDTESETEWEDLDYIDDESDDLTFETGRLDPYKNYGFKVVAVNKNEEYESEELSIETAASVIYSTVWTTRDMAFFKDSESDEQLGTVAVLSALSVLEEENGRFLVRYGEEEGYIDSNYCMINLPDYIGDLCDYDITNSYASLYTAHNYAIPGVTGTVISGYENVLLNDGSFLVPLLYPTAKKLVPAAENAKKDGYTIKIYDSFRPYVATRFVYDTTSQCLDYMVPSYYYTRITVDDYMNGNRASVLGLSSLTKYEPEIVYASEGDAVGEEVIDPNVVTYKNAMLGSGYNLGAFLAASASRHNLGVAMDMTIVRNSDGVELSAQSEMHDLSYHSVQAYNNENAILLKNYMEPAGFGMITSEWWHYQDNESKNTLNPSIVSNGVSVQGWKKDDKGWKYRLADGSFYENTTAEIDGKSYSFDRDGYSE